MTTWRSFIKERGKFLFLFLLFLLFLLFFFVWKKKLKNKQN